MSDTKKIILLFHKSFQPFQGHYLRTYNQAAALVRDGNLVTLLAWDRECRYDKEELRDGIRILRYWIRAGSFQGPRNALNVLRYNVAVFCHLLRSDFDVVVCYSLDAMLAALFAARLRRRKAVLDLCEPEYYAFWGKKHAWLLRIVQWLERTFAKRYNRVFVHNKYQVEKFTSRGIAHVTRIGSYPNRSLLPERIPERDGKTIVIGRFGTLYADNGIEEFIAGFRLFLEQQKDGRDCRFLLAGKVLDTYRPALESALKPLGDRVILEGAFTPADVPGLYSRVDISNILYRRTDWFRNITPTKLFESMANGVPVLASDMGDVREIVESSECGVVVNEEDPESICEGLRRLSDDESRRCMAGAALCVAKERYTWEAYEDAFLDAIRSL